MAVLKRNCAIVIVLTVITTVLLTSKLQIYFFSGNSSCSARSSDYVFVNPRILFYVFPQWHSVPENNRIHGWDFTDWDLVRKLSQRTAGNKNVQTPTELGWYNLLSYHVRKRQWELLREYGGYGFIYHVYWFTDHPTMDEPMRQMLADRDINIPYIVSWANEDWIARWKDGDNRLIMSINISTSRARRKFFQYLLPFFRDYRYIRDFKQWAIEAGLPGLHCHQVLAHFHSVTFNPFEPQNFHVPVSKLADGVTEFQPNLIKNWTSARFLSAAHIPRQHPAYHWRGLHVDFDIGPRHTFSPTERSHPFLFEKHLRKTIEAMQNDIQKHSLIPSDQYVSVNGWNEWSEGNTMEPSTLYGRGYLEAMQIVIMKHVKNSKVCVLLAASHKKESFELLSLTLNSIHAHLTEVEWEMLVYSTDPTPRKPTEFMDYIRNTTESRLRAIDVPISLQQTNTSGYDVLSYLMPHCHAVRNSHYVLFLEAGYQVVKAPHSPKNWESSWYFAVFSCDSGIQERTAERIWSLEVNRTLAYAFASKWSRHIARYSQYRGT
ncbi:unnamed protein product [Adineta ricciae]|uniref:Uncharacterized protein n=1 Tax=Adineta ricciae TaxID=249248 RepID=A0A816EY42_ADIRI|nr:unnamed protein product [Adineta ricciae]